MVVHVILSANGVEWRWTDDGAAHWAKILGIWRTPFVRAVMDMGDKFTGDALDDVAAIRVEVDRRVVAGDFELI